MTKLLDNQPEAEAVALAMALLWAPVNRTRIAEALRCMDARLETGQPFRAADVSTQLEILHAKGLIRFRMRDTIARRRSGHGAMSLVTGQPETLDFSQGTVFWLSDEARASKYRDLLKDHDPDDLRFFIFGAYGVSMDRYHFRWSWPFYDREPTVALVRLTLFLGASGDEIEELKQRVDRQFEWNSLWPEACLEAFDPQLFQRLDPHWRETMYCTAVAETCARFRLDLLDIYRWVLKRTAQDVDALGLNVRQYAAMARLLRGERREADPLLKGVQSGMADALHAAALAMEGEWEKAREAFPPALKLMRSGSGRRSRYLSPGISWLYPLSLLGDPTPDNLEKARKFCQNESGTRKAHGTEGWLLWVHSIAVRTGAA